MVWEERNADKKISNLRRDLSNALRKIQSLEQKEKKYTNQLQDLLESVTKLKNNKVQAEIKHKKLRVKFKTFVQNVYKQSQAKTNATTNVQTLWIIKTVCEAALIELSKEDDRIN